MRDQTPASSTKSNYAKFAVVKNVSRKKTQDLDTSRGSDMSIFIEMSKTEFFQLDQQPAASTPCWLQWITRANGTDVVFRDYWLSQWEKLLLQNATSKIIAALKVL